VACNKRPRRRVMASGGSISDANEKGRAEQSGPVSEGRPHRSSKVARNLSFSTIPPPSTSNEPPPVGHKGLMRMRRGIRVPLEQVFARNLDVLAKPPILFLASLVLQRSTQEKT